MTTTASQNSAGRSQLERCVSELDGLGIRGWVSPQFGSRSGPATTPGGQRTEIRGGRQARG
jgi:hypothetical protein